jgi:hypothetical protein
MRKRYRQQGNRDQVTDVGMESHQLIREVL